MVSTHVRPLSLMHAADIDGHPIFSSVDDNNLNLRDDFMQDLLGVCVIPRRESTSHLLPYKDAFADRLVPSSSPLPHRFSSLLSSPLFVVY